jgi:hypothetical protein
MDSEEFGNPYIVPIFDLRNWAPYDPVAGAATD